MNASSANVSEVSHVKNPAQNQIGSIFNHDILNFSRKELIGKHLYSGRALGLTEVNDMIQLNSDLNQEWPFITAHYERAGLTYTKNVVWDTSYQLLSEFSDYKPSFSYYGGGEIYNRYTDSNYFNIVRFINSRNNFIRVAQDLRLPILKTFCYEDKDYIMDTSVFPYPCYLKASVATSGLEVRRCENETELFHALNNFAGDAPLQIQEEVNALFYINVQYKIKQTKAERFDVTSQLFEDNELKCNQHPAKYSCWKLTDKYAEYLYYKGMRGVFSFKVAVIKNNNDIDFRLIECIPCFSEASYASWITKKLGVDQWIEKTFSCNIRSLRQLDLSGIEYKAGSRSGVVLVNCGPIIVGQISALVIGTPKQQQILEEEFNKRIV